jgi:hypothetical protein
MGRMRPHLHDNLRRLLVELRRPDGGLPTSPAGPSEVEPTTLAALALDSDRDARDATLKGWGWTSDTRSFVEPTSRVLIAAKRLSPGDRRVRADATRLLREWQCYDGGWNHGVAHVLDAKLPGYAQTTAMALIALQGERGAYVDEGVEFLRDAWRREPGALTTAQALVAFRLHGIASEVRDGYGALERMAGLPAFAEKPVAVAWAALATGPDELLGSLRART